MYIYFREYIKPYNGYEFEIEPGKENDIRKKVDKLNKLKNLKNLEHL